MTTQFVNASYQEIVDLHTESDKVSVVGIHTPSNRTPVTLLKPFWDAYQRVRYLGCSMSFVPAARMPADPSQVSYGSGEPPIDPRDLLNPILFHGCHGNDLGSILNQFYAGDSGTTDVDRYMTDSTDHNMMKTSPVGNGPLMESLYYRALTDNTWLKAHPQRGFRKSMRPMVYSLATNTSMNPNTNAVRGGSITQAAEDETEFYGLGVVDADPTTRGYSVLGSGTTTNAAFSSTASPGLQNSTGTAPNVTVQNAGTYSGQFIFTPSIRPLGWIDTRQWTSGAGTAQTGFNGDEQDDAYRLANMYDTTDNRYSLIPKLFMGIVMLPPAYKTEQYFRIVINHRFAFSKYRGFSMRQPFPYATAGNVFDENNRGST